MRAVSIRPQGVDRELARQIAALEEADEPFAVHQGDLAQSVLLQHGRGPDERRGGGQ